MDESPVSLPKQSLSHRVQRARVQWGENLKDGGFRGDPPGHKWSTSGHILSAEPTEAADTLVGQNAPGGCEFQHFVKMHGEYVVVSTQRNGQLTGHSWSAAAAARDPPRNSFADRSG